MWIHVEPVTARRRRIGCATEHCHHVELVGVLDVTVGRRIGRHRIIEGVLVRVRHLVPTPRRLGTGIRDELAWSRPLGIVEFPKRLHAGDVNRAGKVPVPNGQRRLRVGRGQDHVMTFDHRSSIYGHDLRSQARAGSHGHPVAPPGVRVRPSQAEDARRGGAPDTSIMIITLFDNWVSTP